MAYVSIANNGVVDIAFPGLTAPTQKHPFIYGIKVVDVQSLGFVV
jgi:hypothetical protein